MARINSNRTALKPVYQWTSSERIEAARILRGTLLGVGVEAHEWREEGDLALHLRRQLTPAEMRFLHAVKADCPVFTHGEATNRMTEDR